MAEEKKKTVCKVLDSGKVIDQEGNETKMTKCDIVHSRKGTFKKDEE